MKLPRWLFTILLRVGRQRFAVCRGLLLERRHTSTETPLCATMSARPYSDAELTLLQKCPLLSPTSIPHAIQEDVSSAADDASPNVLDPGDEVKVEQRSPKSWRLGYQDFLPGRTGNWDKSETFQ